MRKRLYYNHKIPFINIENFEPEQNALDLINKSFATKYKIIPMEDFTNITTFAMSNDSDDIISLRDKLQLILKKKLKKGILFFKATSKEILNSIEKHY